MRFSHFRKNVEVQIKENIWLLLSQIFSFSVGYYFSTCGNSIGPLGPANQHCKDAYKDTNVSVAIGDDSKSESESHSIGYVTGIQRWMVPRTGLYT